MPETLFLGLFQKLVSGVFLFSISLNFGYILLHQINELEESLRIRRGSADRVSCMSSLPTIMIGRKCPKDQSTFEERKRVLNCSSVPQNCTDPLKFQYHCVLNEYANQSVEVCAIATRILGSVCAEFNKGGKFVQEHYTTPVPCSKCPFVYTSTDAYKYQECYKGIQNVSLTTTSLSTYPVPISSTQPTFLQSTSSNIPELNVEKNKSYILWILVVAGVIVIAILLGKVIFIKYKRHQHNQPGAEGQQPSEENIEQETPFIELKNT